MCFGGILFGNVPVFLQGHVHGRHGVTKDDGLLMVWIVVPNLDMRFARGAEDDVAVTDENRARA